MYVFMWYNKREATEKNKSSVINHSDTCGPRGPNHFYPLSTRIINF